MADELTRLRGRVRWHEHDKQILIAERDDAIAEADRLRQLLDPSPQVLDRLIGQPDSAGAYPAEPAERPRRRWLPTRQLQTNSATTYPREARDTSV